MLNNILKNFFLQDLLPVLYNSNLKKKEQKFYFKKTFKSKSIVTKHDLYLEKKITNLIKVKFPDHQILSEEKVQKKTSSEYTWIIDPLDGTKSYILNFNSWSNLICLTHNGKPICSLVNFPILDKNYFFFKDKIFTINNKKLKKLPIKKKNIKLQSSKIVSNSWYLLKNRGVKKFLEKNNFFFKIISLDALSYFLLVENKIEVIIEKGIKNFDIVPILPFLKLSGALITNFKGQKDLKDEVIISKNRKLHQFIIKKINEKKN